MNILRRTRFALSLVTLSCLVTAGTAAELATNASWPKFQNGGQCVIAGAKLPKEWSSEANITWKAKIEGYGQSTPIVSGDQIVVTSTSGPNKENYFVASFALSNGEKLWQVELTNPSPVENTSYVSRAAPTGVADADGFIAYFEGGLVVALDHQGNIRWQRNLVEDYGPITSRHGLSSSLEQNDKHIFVWVERSEEPYLAALNKSDGETVWKVDGLGSTSWSSPRLIPVGDTVQLICSASGKIAGFDPATGKRLWDFDQISNNTTCTPIPVANGRFLIGASDGRGEAAAQTDGTSNGVIEIVKQEDGTYQADFAWQAVKAKSSFGSPIVADGTAYFVNRSGVLFGVDLESGKQKSTARLPIGGIWATPLSQDNLLYLFGSKGTTAVIDMTSGDPVAENVLFESAPAEEGQMARGGETLYSAVAVPPYLILRTGDTLYALKNPSSE
ncbi:PQQ-binding-like beta-propeller repeat protein [Blastopirellula marina]|uniref:Serine/threonine protein kinase n=1 Tax=Blastopirellula marina TaxID=124 RepID=A0A2S8F9K4_9BACT|nr:PQQ-binding-like beta-propeller repeat protein [Blastopirellula marina]PQO28831.1 serine/threonine protein kinase [Blastopirellula marina]PTL42104.1 serine/threonine protein kinase [Blastopirellula marina]